MQLSLKLPMWVAKEKYVNDIKAVTKKKKKVSGKVSSDGFVTIFGEEIE